jgi:hypothetical protein
MSLFAKHAAVLLARGYSPIPIRTGQKRPLFNKWHHLRTKPMAMTEIGRFERWDTVGIGVAGGFNQLVPVDVDSDDPAVLDAVRLVLPPITVAKVGEKGFTAFFWDASGRIEARKFKPTGRNRSPLVELLVSGQTVLPPTLYPGTSRPYQWLTKDTLYGVAVHDLPVIMPNHIEALEAALVRYGVPPARHYEPVPEGADAPVADDPRMRAYADAVLTACVSELRSLTGGRNNGLFDATCRVAKYVHHGVLPLGEVQKSLLGAAVDNGYVAKRGRNAAYATFRSGLRKAQQDRLPTLANRTRNQTAGLDYANGPSPFRARS